MLADKVHLVRLVELGGELDGAVEQQHLVDKQVAEHARAVDNDVHAGATELLERDDLSGRGRGKRDQSGLDA